MATAQLGLRENAGQFALLVLVNAFVGGMVGLERSILPELAKQEFSIAAKKAILSFIVAFGLAKAATNYFSGLLANRFGRKKLLIAGWLFGIPVPLILLYAPDWNWVILANVFLGINQGLAWSSTVVMKIDLVGERQRGLAMGLNEFAGYIAVALVAFLTGWIAHSYGLRPYPFITGIVLVFAGLIISLFFVRDTMHHVSSETSDNKTPRLRSIFLETSWTNKNLGTVTVAGLVNNLNDGMIWGLLPLLLASKGFSLKEIGIVTAVYPAVWGITQIITGMMADRYSKKKILFTGMLLQGVALFGLIPGETLGHYITASVALGLGTAMVYPTFLATIAENTNPKDRAESIGVFRLWRDLGYAIGAILTGFLADAFSVNSSIGFVAGITVFAGVLIRVRMMER